MCVKGVLVKRVKDDLIFIEVDRRDYAWGIESKFFVKIPAPRGAK